MEPEELLFSAPKAIRVATLETDLNRQSESRLPFLYGLGGLYALITALLALTWRKWPDAIVDFGRELYVPWRLAQGDVLYVDIAYFNGPFSPYFNATLFRLFGSSLTTMIVTNVVLLTILTTIVFRLLNRVVRHRTALIACATFLIVFAFSHSLRIGNYNYICPYSHELTHGIILTFAMLAFLFSKHIDRTWCQLFVGVLWGCVWLGKAEMFTAATGMLLTSQYLHMRRFDHSLLRALRQVGVNVAGGLIPVAFFVVMLAQRMTWSEAFQGVLGTWVHIFSSNVTGDSFYKELTGFDRPLLSVLTILRSAMAIVLVCLGAGWIESWRERSQKKSLLLASLAFGGAALFSGGIYPLLLHESSLTLVALTVFIVLLVQRRAHRDREKVSVDLAIVWVVMAGLLLAKFPLRPSIMHYGFVLAMPIVVLAVALCLDRLPKLLCPLTGGNTCFAVLCFMLLADVMASGVLTLGNLNRKSTPLGSANDLLMTDPTRGGDHVAKAVEFLKANTSPSHSVMVVPEGVMINYMARRESDSPFVNLCPVEFSIYGEANIHSTISNAPSDYVVLVNKDVAEYGKERFGVDDYGADVMNWINQNYETVQVFGNPFEASTEHGVTIMKRIPAYSPVITGETKAISRFNSIKGR